MKRILFSCLLFLVLVPASAVSGIDKTSLQATIQAFNQSARPVRQGFLDYPGYTLKLGDEDYTCLVPSTMRRLAQAGESFTVRKVHTKRDYFVVELQTTGKRKLRISVYDHGALTQALVDQGLPRLLGDIFAYGAAPAPVAFVGNRESLLVHHDRCNHMPPAPLREVFASRDAAMGAGFRACPICFGTMTNLPYANYVMYRTEGLKAAKEFELVYPVSPDTSLQSKLDRLGQVVLDGWPLDLAGFDYEFRVVQSDLPLAWSFATGIVMVSDTMMKAAEADEEILFILAHEIAHCEIHMPPRAPFENERPLPPQPGFEAYINWVASEQRVADMVAVGWFASQPDGRWSMERARPALAKIQQAVNEFEGKSEDDYWLEQLFVRRWFFEPARYVPGNLRHVFLAEDGEGDVRYEIRPLGFLASGKTVKPVFLLTTTDYQEKTLYNFACTGNFRADNDRYFEFVTYAVAAVPGQTTLVVGKPLAGTSVSPSAIKTMTRFTLGGLNGSKPWREDGAP